MTATRRRWAVSSTPRPHFTPGKDPVTILQEAGWASGPVWTGGESLPHRDSILDSPARSQSLYRLSYPAPTVNIMTVIVIIIMVTICNTRGGDEKCAKKTWSYSFERHVGTWGLKHSSLSFNFGITRRWVGQLHASRRKAPVPFRQGTEQTPDVTQ